MGRSSVVVQSVSAGALKGICSVAFGPGLG